MYYIYHIPGVKIGVTTNLKDRVERQQGYGPGEYKVLTQTEDIELVSLLEHQFQRLLGYRVDRQLYKDLHNNNFKQLNNMDINITEMTTTFPCPVNKLKGHLMDNIGMSWETEHGNCVITNKSIEWIMDNVKSSQYTQERCYIYNKAFARWFENNNAYDNMFDNAKQANLADQYNGRTTSGALAPTGARQEKCKPECNDRFDLIREWASERGLYDKGDPKTQTLKLIEEAGEICRAVLKDDREQIIDGIGDCVVVLTNLAELVGYPIEKCIDAAYDEIKNRTGKMSNGTFKKD
jgi:NTP pyrophosphatase (non-canonical NTP hydrolase)